MVYVRAKGVQGRPPSFIVGVEVSAQVCGPPRSFMLQLHGERRSYYAGIGIFCFLSCQIQQSFYQLWVEVSTLASDILSLAFAWFRSCMLRSPLVLQPLLASEQKTIKSLILDADEKIRLCQHSDSSTEEALTTKERVFLHMEYHPNDIPRKLIRTIYNQNCGELFEEKLGIKQTTILHTTLEQRISGNC